MKPATKKSAKNNDHIKNNKATRLTKAPQKQTIY